MRVPSLSLTLVIWGACSNPWGSNFEPLISRAVWGNSQVPRLLHLQVSRVPGRASAEPLISSTRESRAPVAPVYFKRASRPLVNVCTLRGSY
jgi:hypothetical protein